MKKYMALKIIAWINIVLGVLCILTSILIAGMLMSDSYEARSGSVFTIISAGLLVGILFIGFGQMIFLFMDIENNTRGTMDNLLATNEKMLEALKNIQSKKE